MLERLFPPRADNTYRGHKAALVILGALLLFRGAISLGTIFNGYNAATAADGIPLDTYTPAGARTVLSMFALLGLSNLVVCLIGVTVLVRYRSLVPVMFASMLFYDVGRRIVLTVLPIARVGAPPGSVINIALISLVVVGFALSLWPRHHDATA